MDSTSFLKILITNNKHLSKADLFCFGEKIVTLLSESIILFRKAYEEEDKEIKKEFLKKIINHLKDFETYTSIMREAMVIDIKKASLYLQYIGLLIKQTNGWLKALDSKY